MSSSASNLVQGSTLAQLEAGVQVAGLAVGHGHLELLTGDSDVVIYILE